MWRAVTQAGTRTGLSKPSTVSGPEGDRDDDLDKAKALIRSGLDDSAWIRKGNVVACFALLALFLCSGLLTHIGRSLAPSAPDVLKYVATFNAESFLDSFNSNEADEELPQEFDPGPGLMNSTKQRPAGCNEADATLKVFMYDLPREFHYGMILADFAPGESQVWPRNVSALPRYPGGLYQQHSPEYWLVSDVLTSDMPDRASPCTAFRVRSWQDADVIFVPFFASLSYNKYSRPAALRGSSSRKTKDRNQELQVKLLSFLKSHPAWRAANGEDHVVVIHHPNSMLYKREQLRSVMFVVADFGRYGAEVANVTKDVVAPYKHLMPTFNDDVESAASFELRRTLLFFQGAVVRKQGGIIRQQLYELLHSEPDVVFATGAATSAGIRSAAAGMRHSKFCLHLAGDTPSSNRLFDAVASHCVPLIISDAIELPFEDVLDYSEFCLFVNSTDALRKGFVTDLLRTFPPGNWTRMHHRIREVERHFQYQHPAILDDAVHMTWHAIARKLPALTLARNKRRRYQKSKSSSASAD